MVGEPAVKDVGGGVPAEGEGGVVGVGLGRNTVMAKVDWWEWFDDATSVIGDRSVPLAPGARHRPHASSSFVLGVVGAGVGAGCTCCANRSLQ